MSDLGVDMIGEVQWRCFSRHLDNITPRADRIYPVFEYIAAELIEQVTFTTGWVEQMPQQTELLVEARLHRAAFLVFPVRRNTQFRMPVHFVGTDLHLNCLSFGANQCGMQRLVAIILGVGDVVVKFPREVGPDVVHDSQCRITLGNVFNEHPDRADIENFLKTLLLMLHFSPDAKDVLRTACNLGLDSVL